MMSKLGVFTWVKILSSGSRPNTGQACSFPVNKLPLKKSDKNETLERCLRSRRHSVSLEGCREADTRKAAFDYFGRLSLALKCRQAETPGDIFICVYS